MDRPAWKRWPRAQRFGLSAQGCDAEAGYRDCIVAARAMQGRTAFDGARAAWAARYAVEPDDGLFLGEMRGSPRTLDEIIRSVEASGADRQQTHEAIDRLTAAGLVDALAPPAPPEPPPRRW